MVNALTVDVEDYFQVTAFERQVKREQWDHYSLRVGDNTLRILDMLEEFSMHASFFILGWVAERLPSLVKEIQRRGHEIACHGYGHELVYRLGPEKFRNDVSLARKILEDICGNRVDGYRAPSYSITRKSLWALDILVEEGFTYDSSIFPVIHDTYGIHDAFRFPHSIKCTSGIIREFPLSTLAIRSVGREHHIPIAGGGYLRLFPVRLISRWIETVNCKEKQPTVLYFHPWEIDPEQPKIKSNFKSSFRHYLNLHKTEGKVRDLLSVFKFNTMNEVLKTHVPRETL